MINNNHSLYNAFIRDLERLSSHSNKLKIAKSNKDKRLALALIKKHRRAFSELLDNMDWLKEEVTKWGSYYGCA